MKALPGLIAASLAMAVGMPAAAQDKPSFDCTKASNAIEGAICNTPELAALDRRMATAYGALAGRLTGPARQHLENDQLRWVANRNSACADGTNAITDCLKSRYAARIDNLKVMGEGPYPFVSEQSIHKAGKLGKISYSIDIRYPQFDGTTADFSAVNRRFADNAGKAAKEATPTSDAGPDHEQQWSYEQSVGLYRPSADAITVALDFNGYSGGAHGYGATYCTLVDLRTGRATGPEGVFVTGDQWLESMVEMVGADLRKQFVENPGFDEALRPAALRKKLRQARHYCWQPDKLELIFNAYEVGPYSAGPYSVEIAYDRLKPLLRPDGPIRR